jgi:phosphate transport system substrate-binding protein
MHLLNEIHAFERGLTRFMYIIAVVSLLQFSLACSPDSSGKKGSEKMIINSGSETMKKLAETWSDAYNEAKPSVAIEVYGGGSGIGLSSLIHGDVDIANASRRITPEEIQYAKEHLEKDPREMVVAYDAVAIYVHKNNPLDKISLDELSEIYSKDGQLTSWSQLDSTLFNQEEIVVINRQPSSGTYQTFKTLVLGDKKEFKTITYDAQTAEEVVDLVSKDSFAIGYSGTAFANENVKVLKISRTRLDEAMDPMVELSKTGLSMYPISRPLYIYTLGKPEKPVQNYINWIMSKNVKHIVKGAVYVSIVTLE